MRPGFAALLPFVLAACGGEEVERVETPVEAPIEAPSDFVRFVSHGEDRADLETVMVSYESESGAVVDLIGVVHLADASYYAALEDAFPGYDAVLYEMIKPEGAAPTSGRDGGSPVSALQRGLCRALDLEFQLEALDYGRPNFVHADLTAEGFARLWEERDESLLRHFFRALAASTGHETGLTPAALFEAARSPKRKARLKLLLGREFSELERTLAGIGEVGADGRDRSMLIGARNEAAIGVLRTRLNAGDRRVAILYGAGHGPDLDVRLTRDLGLARRRLTWRTAWRIDATGG